MRSLGSDVSIHFEDLSRILRSHFSVAEHAAEILAPYVQVDAVEEVLHDVVRGVAISVVTTWKLLDMLAGASSLDLYPYLKARGAFLFLNQRLHLKTYLVDRRYALTGSANTTRSGLGLVADANHETLAAVDETSAGYMDFLESIKRSSVLVTDAVYEKFVAALELCEDVARPEVARIQRELDRDVLTRDCFLVSELPMSRSLDDLFEWQQRRQESGLEEESRQNARHDLVKYGLVDRTFQTKDEFLRALTDAFFAHPFVTALCTFIDRPKRFGAIKEWVQNNCTDVPVPSRRDLTGNVQVLYHWLKTLGADRYRVIRPRHSELIEPV